MKIEGLPEATKDLQVGNTGFLKRLFFLLYKGFCVLKKEGLLIFLKKTTMFLARNCNRRIFNPVFLFFYKKKIILKSQQKIKDFIKNKNFLMFAPWVVLGGADKLIIEYIRAARNEFKIGLITTIKPGDRVSMVDSPFFDLNSSIKGWNYLSEDEQCDIIVDAIINSSVKIIHIVNSELAIKMVLSKKKALDKNNIKIVTSLFALGYDKSVEKFSGYPLMYPNIMIDSNLILSDNKYWFSIFREIIGMEFNYKKIHSPVKKHNINKKSLIIKKKILWASRICDTKFIDLLYKICQSEEQITFVIYGNIGDDRDANMFFDKIVKLKNIEYRGAFNDFLQVDPTEFDIFLYTSYIDGLPNIVLEISTMGIPIISSKICGVSEVLGNSNLLVENIEDFNEYIKKINVFYNNPMQFYKDASKIRYKVQETHSEENFKKEYLEAINLLLS